MCRMSDQPCEITEFLHRWREGNTEAEKQLLKIVMPNQRRLAHYPMNRERKDYSLLPTDLAGTAYLRLIAARDWDWQGRKDCFDAASGPPNALPPVDAIILDRCPDQPARVKPDWCTVVEMKYFPGFTDDQSAEETGVPLRALQRMRLKARKWLYPFMETRNGPSAGR